MSTEPENFENLRKLLALKRHEQPPPGYFNQLPDQIWSRIESEEGKPSFWEKLFPSFGIKPALAYGFAVVTCGVLIVGIGSTLNNESHAPSAAPTLAHDPQPYTITPVAPAAGLNPNPEISSTNPVIDPFVKPRIEAQPVGFQP